MARPKKAVAPAPAPKRRGRQPKAASPQKVTPRIVEAAGVASAQGGQRTSLSEAIEAAMRGAIEEATAAGISDPVKVRERIVAARNKVLGG